VSTTFETTLAHAPGEGRDPSRRGSVRKPVLIVLAVVVAVALIVWGLVSLSGGTQSATTTVDASADPDGLLAFVLLLEAFEAEVAPGGVDDLAEQDVVFVLPDVDVSSLDRQALEAWQAGGGVLVEVPPTVVPFATVRPVVPVEAGACDIAALSGVDIVVVDGFDGLVPTEAPAASSCVSGTNPDLAFVVSERAGLGVSVQLGGVSPFTNALLGEEDNPVLATSLFAPVPGTRVLFFVGSSGLPTGAGSTQTPSGGSGDSGVGGSGDGSGGESEGSQDEGDDEPSLLDQIPVGVRFAFLQLVVAFLLFAWARGRRVGDPVSEPQPVDIAGSELVLAVGELLARTKSPEQSASVLRSHVCRQLAGRVGLPGDADPRLVATTVALRTGGDPDETTRLLAGAPVTTDDGLVDLARRLDALREEIFHGVAP